MKPEHPNLHHYRRLTWEAIVWPLLILGAMLLLGVVGVVVR